MKIRVALASLTLITASACTSAGGDTSTTTQLRDDVATVTNDVAGKHLQDAREDLSRLEADARSARQRDAVSTDRYAKIQAAITALRAAIATPTPTPTTPQPSPSSSDDHGNGHRGKGDGGDDSGHGNGGGDD